MKRVDDESVRQFASGSVERKIIIHYNIWPNELNGFAKKKPILNIKTYEVVLKKISPRIAPKKGKVEQDLFRCSCKLQREWAPHESKQSADVATLCGWDDVVHGILAITLAVALYCFVGGFYFILFQHFKWRI